MATPSKGYSIEERKRRRAIGLKRFMAAHNNFRGPSNPNWKGGITKDNYTRKLKTMEKYPEKFRARALAEKAIKRGTLIRGVCEVCGASEVQAHHDDYSKPYEVRWFCQEHHRNLDEHHRTPNKRKEKRTAKRRAA
jgi:ribosomal protein S27AE